MTDVRDPFGECLTIGEYLPVDWQPLDALPDAGRLQALNAEAVQLLSTVGSLEESHLESRDDDDPLLSQDLLRMDHKLNLLLTLVGQLIARDHDQPAATHVDLCRLGIVWGGPADSEFGLLAMYLPAFPATPLRLAARIVQRDSAHGRVWARFEGLDDTVHDHLDKFVFRHHRRHVAAAHADR